MIGQDDVKKPHRYAEVREKFIMEKLENRLVLTKKEKICTITTFFCGVLLIFVGCFVPLMVEHVIHNKISETVIMKPGNEALWAQLPGDSGVDVHRVVTFYEFKNPMDVLFRGKTPLFKETKGYDLLMKQAFMNTKYEDGFVAYDRFTYFTKPNQNLEKESVTLVNPGCIGIWTYIKNINAPTLSLNTVGALIQNLVEQVPMNIYFLGFSYKFLKDYSQAKTILNSVPEESKRQQIWKDIYFGLSSPNTMEFWVRAANEGHDFGVATKALKDYFQLSQEQISGVNKQLRVIIKSLNYTTFNFYSCNDPSAKVKQFKYDCTGQYFSAVQFNSQGVSLNPPPGMGIPIAETVVVYNDTLHDFPEISYFYNKYFLVNIDSSPEYLDLKFDLDWMYKFMARNYDYPSTPVLQDESILIHKANLEFLYECGEQYDKSASLSDLEPVMARFKLPSVQHSRVIWEWVKQINSLFAKRSDLKGTSQEVGLAIFTTQELHWAFRNLTEYLLPSILSNMVITSRTWTDCASMMQASIDDISNQQIQATCAISEMSSAGEQTITYLLNLCEQPYSDQWQGFKDKSGLTSFQMLQMCEDGKTDESFQTLLDKSDAILKQQFNCKFERCSKLELAFKQWSRSEVTKNVPQGCNFPVSKTVNSWNPNIFKKPFEYGFFREEFADLFSYEPQVLSDDDAKNLLHFRRLFNTLAMTTSFVLAKSDKQKEFTDMFIFKHYDNLLHYLRYIGVELGFGGFTMQRTPEEVMFGYKDEVIDMISQKDPAGGGGDPSKLSWLKLSDSNMTENDAKLFPAVMKTGSNDLSEARKFVSVSGKTTAMFNNTVFNGNGTFTEWQNPWNTDEHLGSGSDGFINSPYMDADQNLSVYVPQIFRTLQFSRNGTKSLFGVQTNKYELTPGQQPAGDQYLNRWTGIHNLSRPYNAPVMVTQPHFYDCDPKLQSLVKFIDDQGNEVKANEWDKSYQYVEPYSGVPLEAVIQMQINIELEQDQLFTGYPFALLPVINLWNSGNFTEKAADSQFGQLRMGLKTKTIGQILAIVVGAVLILLVFAVILYKALKNRKRVELLMNDERSKLQDQVSTGVPQSNASLHNNLLASRVDEP